MNNTGAGHKTIKTNRIMEMKAFDKLPVFWREFLRNTTLNFSAEQVHSLRKELSGAEIIQKAILRSKQVHNKNYPGLNNE